MKKSVVIGDMTKSYEMSTNKEMISLQGEPANIIEVIENVYNGKKYFRLDIDNGRNLWSEEMLITNKQTHEKAEETTDKYIGLKLMDREGERYEIFGFDTEEGEFLGKSVKSNFMFAEYTFTENELLEEIKDQTLREKFYRYASVM